MIPHHTTSPGIPDGWMLTRVILVRQGFTSLGFSKSAITEGTSEAALCTCSGVSFCPAAWDMAASCCAFIFDIICCIICRLLGSLKSPAIAEGSGPPEPDCMLAIMLDICSGSMLLIMSAACLIMSGFACMEASSMPNGGRQKSLAKSFMGKLTSSVQLQNLALLVEVRTTWAAEWCMHMKMQEMPSKGTPAWPAALPEFLNAASRGSAAEPAAHPVLLPASRQPCLSSAPTP